MLQHTKQASGFNCPSCKGFIPISVTELIKNNSVVCPICKLQLSINREASQSAIAALEKVQTAQENVDKASIFR